MIFQKIKRLFGGVAEEVEIPGVGAPGIAPRTLTVFLPSHYEAKHEHALLIALDGQTMPGWRLGETLHRLGKAKQIAPTVVVAVPASRHRMDEYGMAGALDYRQRGEKAAAFQRYLLEAVLPRVRERVALTRDPARTGIFGASMGGLAAFDAAWRHADVFGFAGVFSGSLWWRGDNSSVAAQQSSRLAHRLVRATTPPPKLRLWFEAGTKDETEDRDGNGVIDAIQDTTELIDELVAKKFRRGTDVAYVEVPGGEHNDATWARALPDFLRWALPPR